MVIKEQRDVIDSKMPAGEKIVYMTARKYRLHSMHGTDVSGEQGDKFYYWVDFNIRLRMRLALTLIQCSQRLPKKQGFS